MTTTSKRVLVIGRAGPVNHRVVDGLRELGFSAVGTTGESPAAEFHARDFELIAIGNGVDDASRRAFKESFKEQNKDVLLLDAYAPVAVKQIASALRRADGAPALASAFSVEDGGEELIARATIREACDLRLAIYRHRGSPEAEVVPVAESSVAPGSHVFKFAKELARDGFMAVLTLNEEEIHLERLDRLRPA